MLNNTELYAKYTAFRHDCAVTFGRKLIADIKVNALILC